MMDCDHILLRKQKPIGAKGRPTFVVTSYRLSAAVARECELFVEGRWVIPEAALLAAVIAQHLEDCVHAARRALQDDPAFGGFPAHHWVSRESREIGAYCEALGMDRMFVVRTLRRLGVMASSDANLSDLCAAHEKILRRSGPSKEVLDRANT